jgi:hypothetical protein
MGCQTKKGACEMTIFTANSEHASAFAAAFLTAMLFLSTAVGPLPIA